MEGAPFLNYCHFGGVGNHVIDICKGASLLSGQEDCAMVANRCFPISGYQLILGFLSVGVMFGQHEIAHSTEPRIQRIIVVDGVFSSDMIQVVIAGRFPELGQKRNDGPSDV